MSTLFRENLILRNSRVSVNQAIAANYVWAATNVRQLEGVSRRYFRYVREVRRYDPNSEYLRRLNLDIGMGGWRKIFARAVANRLPTRMKHVLVGIRDRIFKHGHNK